MLTVEKMRGGRVYIRPLDQNFSIGDRIDVDAEMAAYLCEERGDFDRVNEPESADPDPDSLVDTLDAASDDSTTGDAEDGEGLPGDETDQEREVSADDSKSETNDNGDGNSGSMFEGEDFSSNGWLDNDYQDRAAAVRAGGLDDYLDEIEAVETSDTVIDAVTERRSELED